MGEFKCKYCGNRLHPEEGQTIITCGRCGETTRIVLTDSVKKIRLMEEADELRFSCLFDRAMQRYETVIQEFPKDADAYWGYVLCIYGVEFHDDARTGKRLPTLHRISSRSITQDPYYQKALEYANPIDAADYQRIGAELERIRNRFLELSQKEENTYDIFISFKQTDDKYHRETVDCSKAENLYHKLKDMGYKVFFSKVTLASRGGDDYEPIIYTALDTAKVMVVVGSNKENLEAPWVRNEWNRFLDMMQASNNKKLLPVLIEGMTPEALPEALQGIQGYNIDTQIGMDRLLSRILELIPLNTEQVGGASKPKDLATTEESLLKRAKMEAEDGNWEKAREYYNRILDANPECSKAWIGMMLSADDVQMTELSQYKECLLNKQMRVEKEDKSVSLDEGEDFVSSFMVPNYLTEEEILDILPNDLKYESVYDSLCENMTDAKRYFDSDQNYAHALQFANPSEREELEQFKTDILGKLQGAINEQKKYEEETNRRLHQQYADQLRKAKITIENRHNEALAQREADYKNGMAVRTGEDVPSAIKLLKKVGNYQDAPKKLKNLNTLKATRDSIGDGSTYLARCIMAEKPQAITNLQIALGNLSNDSNGTGGGTKKWIAIGLYAFLMLDFLVSGNILSIGCMIIGTALGVVLWKKNLPYVAYIVYCILHTIAGTIYSSEWLIVLPVIYIVSFVRKKGFVNSLISRKNGMIVVDDAKNVIKDYEKNLRDRIDRIWKNAIGISYDGVKLNTILDTLQANNYAFQTGVQPSSETSHITSKVNVVQKTKTSRMVNVDGQNRRESFNMDDFKDLFGDLFDRD